MKVILFGAGGPAGVNFARACARDPEIHVIGLDENPEHLVWAEPWCDHVELLHPDTLLKQVERLTDEDTLLHSQPEEMLLWIHEHIALRGRRFLPSRSVILKTQDKFEAALEWRRQGMRDDRVELVQDVSGVYEAAERIGLPMWIRARHGAGARGAALVRSIPEGENWVGYWLLRDPKMDFIAEAYLPGRDLAWESIWKHGTLIASYLRERTEYIYPRLAPSGKTGTPVVAKVIHDDIGNTQAMAAVLAIDPEPHGIYSVDMVEDADGIARPTEINAGRFFTTSYLSAMAGVSFPALYVRLAFNHRVPKNLPAFDTLPEGTYARHIDCEAVWTPSEPGLGREHPVRLDERRLALPR